MQENDSGLRLGQGRTRRADRLITMWIGHRLSLLFANV
jgi:hypothetical protein